MSGMKFISGLLTELPLSTIIQLGTKIRMYFFKSTWNSILK